MNPSADNANATAWEGPGDRARQVMWDYLDVLRGYTAVPHTEEDPAHVQRTQSKPLEAADLPANMRQLLEKYRDEHSGAILSQLGIWQWGRPARPQIFAGSQIFRAKRILSFLR